MAKAQVPFSDPPWLMGLPSPYFSESHRKWQAAIRPFIQRHLHDHAVEWETAEVVPPHVFADFAAANMLIPALPAPLPVKWLKKLGIHELLGGLKVEDFDSLHGLIFGDEMGRSGLAGPPGSLTTGIAFGVPPILQFASPPAAGPLSSLTCLRGRRGRALPSPSRMRGATSRESRPRRPRPPAGGFTW